MALLTHRRFVLFLKIALPLALIAAIAVAIVVPRLGREEGFDFSGFDVSDGMRMANPRFNGVTRSGQPYEIASDWAQPDSPDPGRVELGPVRGWIDLDPARRATIVADGGVALPHENLLRLSGNVIVETTDGYRLRTGEAEIDIADSTLRAPGPVAGAGPAGEIEAGSMRASRDQAGDVIWFEDRVRVVIEPSRG
jgi:lipopolysaccharide export system protein LptC